MPRTRRPRAPRIGRAVSIVLIVAGAIVAVALWSYVFNRPSPAAPEALAQPANEPTPAPTPTPTPTVAPTATPVAKQTVAVFIGDSYTAGVGSTAQSKSFPAIVGAKLGWDVVNFGRSGTGYSSDVSSEKCDLDKCPSYTDMIGEAVKASPDVVVVSGGREALGNKSAGAEKIKSFYRELREAFPDAQLIAVSPIWDDGNGPAKLDTLAERVEKYSTRVNATYVDIGEPLRDQPDLIVEGESYPNDSGYAEIASVILQRLAD